MAATELNELRELLQKFDTAVLITHAGEGKMRARPMAIAAVEENCGLWFISGRDTAKVHEIEHNTRVTIVCQDGHRVCIAVSGWARLVEDRGKLDQVWNDSFRTWFPRGKDDPGICLIYVRGEEAEFWKAEGAKAVRYIFDPEMAVAGGNHLDSDNSVRNKKVEFV
jgi:general stress protein 26